MGFLDTIGEAGKYIIGTGADLYKATLDAKTTQAVNKAGAEIAKAKADDTITVGGYEISVTKTLLIVAGAAGLILLATLARK